jgi:hypothetical protein
MAQSLQLKSLVGCRWRIVDPSLELQFCAGLAGKIVNYRTIVDGRNVAPIVSPRATKAKEYAKGPPETHSTGRGRLPHACDL